MKKHDVELPDDFDPVAAIRARTSQIERAEAARANIARVRASIEQGGHTESVASYERDLAASQQNEREANEAIARWDELLAAHSKRAA